MAIRQLACAAAAAILVGAAAAPAAAAPQVLGLVASASPLPLACDAEGCRIELSSFCLQQPRPNPLPGALYRPAADAQIFLVGTDLRGAAVRLPAAPYLRFASARGFTAVAAEISAADLRKLGLAQIAIEIGRDVSLIPTARADDAEPQSDEEIATATGPIRRAAQPFFDDTGESADAIRLTNAMINALPVRGRSPADSDGRLLGATAAAHGTPVDPAGVALARSIHTACVGKVDVSHHVFSMRDCLENSHDRLVIDTNLAFWESLGGS